jgi:hypothetical protein
VNERNVSLLFNGKLGNIHYYSLLLVAEDEEEARLDIFDKICFCRQSLLKNISFR